MVRILLVFWLFLLPATAVVAQETAGGQAETLGRSILEQEEITLADLLQLAELASPRLAAAYSGVQARAGRVKQAGLYPNPVIELAVGELSTDDTGDRKEKVSLVMPLVLGGRRGAAVAAARVQQEAAAHWFDAARRDVFLRVHTLWAEQIYHREADQVFRELLDVANHTLSIARARHDARAAPESQVTRALLEVYELEVARDQQVAERVSGSAELSSLLGGLSVPVDRLIGALVPDGASIGEGLPTSSLEDHPALLAARRNVDAAEASLREARAARIPDLSLSVAYGRNRARDDGFVEAGVSMPLPVFDRNQGRVAETRSLAAQAHHHARMVHGELESAVVAARQRHRSVRDQLQSMEGRILPAAERGFAQATEGYRAGHLPFLELIDAQRIHGNTRLRVLELRKALVIAEAELTSLVGAGPGEEREETP